MLYRRALGACNRFLRVVSYRGGRGDIVLLPRAAYPCSSSPPPTHQAGTSSQPPVCPPYPGLCTTPQAHAPAAGTSLCTPTPPPFWHAPAGFADRRGASEDFIEEGQRSSVHAWVDDIFRPEPDVISA
uniref:Uncharacterized protein n=1 Tax=Setaria viridis TaxID=4556 RepID=A0A4U6V2W1_SETVI|nr:hypothetical protein SEVIR_4G285600v2 [Setaria viridis]